jgi:Tfp pilus assembly protein PilF
MMSNKNPFEIRSEMLQLAKDYMDQQYHMNVQFAEKMLDQGKMQVEEFQKIAEMYSVEELMEKAKEMYSFVSKRDDTKD